MASTAAYSGLRWGELTALTIAQVDQAARVIAVDRKVVEVAGHLYAEAPKNRKFRRTIYPRRTPSGTRWPSGSPPANPSISASIWLRVCSRSSLPTMPDQDGLTVIQLA